MHEDFASDEARHHGAFEERLSRGRFLRKAGAAGALGLALTAVGDLVAAPFASARASSARPKPRFILRGTDSPNICTGYANCTRCNACCGHPCTPYGVSYCYHCVTSNCGSSYYACYSNEPDSFTICCQ